MNNKYNSYKAFLYPLKLDAIRSQEVTSPIHVRIKPINSCNHKCWYCCYRHDDLQLGKEMKLADVIPRKKMLEIITDLAAMKVAAVTFSGGGEPLLYPHFVEALTALGDANIKTAILTNGSKLNGERADALAKYASWVRVSMDSWDAKSHQEARSVGASDFETILDNIRKFTERDTNCDLGVNFIITKDNYLHIREFCSLMKSLGVDHVKLSACVISNDVTGNNEYHDSIQNQANLEIKSAIELEGDGFKIINHYHRMTKNFVKEYKSCAYLNYLTIIGADCKVYTCQDKAYTKSGLLGDISEQSFKDFWFSKTNKESLFGLNPSQKCQHHCVSHDKNLIINDFLGIDLDHSSFV